jgi:capsular polysaccharide export protein
MNSHAFGPYVKSQSMTEAFQRRRFLFLQGPISPFFYRLGVLLRARGHAVHRINLCRGDTLFWPEPAMDFTGRIAAWPGFIADVLARHAITDMVLLGEQRDHHALAISAAHAAGVAVTVTDFGYIRPDWIILERDGMNRDSRFPRDPAAIHALAAGLPPVDEQTRHLDDFAQQARWDMKYHLANLLPGRFRHYRSFLLHHPIPAYIGTGLALLRRKAEARRAEALQASLPARAPRWLFAMQMETDYSIRAYSEFKSMDEAIARVVASFARAAPAEGHLLVKVHPLDPGLKPWRRIVAAMAARHGVAGRVHFLGAGHLDATLQAARGVLTVNSTVGIRALQLGRAVHAMGEAIYRCPGLTHMGALDEFWTAGPPDAELADAFLRAIAACLHIRGVYYREPGLTVAVAAAAGRLERGLVGEALLMG